MDRLLELTSRRPRRKRAPPSQLPDSFRTLNLEFPGRNNIVAKTHDKCMPEKKEQHYTLEWRNNPQPRHAKCIKTNTKFLNEPIFYMDTEDTKATQAHWWPSCASTGPHPRPPYGKQSTQRNDFQKPSCLLSRPVKYSSKLQPSRGIVPLACPRTPTSLPRIFQEQLSFKHNYNARATPCIPYQGKKQGAFVWTEIKPMMGTAVPESTKAVSCAGESGSLEEPRIERENAVGNRVTSPCLCLPDSQETPDSNTHLSEPNIEAGVQADPPRASKKGQEGSGIAQANGVKASHPAGKAPAKPLRKGSLDKLQDHLPPVHKTLQSPAEREKLRA